MGYTAVVDYNVGNLLSVTNALKYLGYESRISSDPVVFERAEDIILPGVGAFPDAAKSLRECGLERVVLEQAQRKPVLGICLGMQLLLTAGEELRETPGLNLIAGRVKKIETKLKLPHIGWNALRFVNKSPLLKNVPEGSFVYFVHSFAAQVEKRENLVAVTDYPGEVTAIVSSGQVFGCQFHPEKSGETGLTILRNFKELDK